MIFFFNRSTDNYKSTIWYSGHNCETACSTIKKTHVVKGQSTKLSPDRASKQILDTEVTEYYEQISIHLKVDTV